MRFRHWLWRPLKPPRNGCTHVCAPRGVFLIRRTGRAVVIPGSLPRQALFVRLPGVSRPRLQAELFRLLRPEEIGVQLTEGFMMEPEASVSALVFHHPDATYFSVGVQELAEATAD